VEYPPFHPFHWNEERRVLFRAELDAYCAKLHGPDFPGETFRVQKEKETKRFGEYRTRRIVLAAWSKLE